MKEQLIEAYFETTSGEEKKKIVQKLDELGFFWYLIEAINCKIEKITFFDISPYLK